MRVRFEGPTHAPTGYGRAAREMAMALGDWYDDCGDVVIHHCKPQEVDAFIDPKGMHFLYTTWETFPLPDGFADCMNNFRAVLVPSTWCQTVLHEAGVDRVFVLPHPLSPEFERQTPHSDIHGTYEFYSIGVWAARKNTEGVLRAYLAEFSRDDDVQLTLLVSNPPFDLINSVIGRTGLPREELPRLYVPDRYYSDAELRALHESSHCYVTAARAEGFGLGAAEAAAYENRVIAPYHTGLIDALAGYEAVDWIQSQKTPAFPDRGRVVLQGNQPIEQISTPVGVDCRQHWWDPNLFELSCKMRYAYQNKKLGAPPHHVYRAEDFRARLEEIVSQL